MAIPALARRIARDLKYGVTSLKSDAAGGQATSILGGENMVGCKDDTAGVLPSQHYGLDSMMVGRPYKTVAGLFLSKDRGGLHPY